VATVGIVSCPGHETTVGMAQYQEGAWWRLTLSIKFVTSNALCVVSVMLRPFWIYYREEKQTVDDRKGEGWVYVVLSKVISDQQREHTTDELPGAYLPIVIDYN